MADDALTLAEGETMPAVRSAVAPVPSLDLPDDYFDPLPEQAADEARHQRIAERAYRRAERRGFAPGAELDDWLAAEAEEDDSRGEN
jgi:hypothetical protein